jgi:hypothetical protein
MQPAVEAGLEGRGPRLTFKLQVDRTGVSSLPAMFDDRVTSLLNQALVRNHLDVAWGFGATLSHVFALPAAVTSAAALQLNAVAGHVTVTEGALAFAVDFTSDVVARRATPTARAE